jgi:hypothetical protein
MFIIATVLTLSAFVIIINLLAFYKFVLLYCVLCKMFVVFEFLICDIFWCAKGINIFVSRCLAAFSVSMIKYCIY